MGERQSVKRSDPVESFAFGIAHVRSFTAREGHSRVFLNHQEAYFSLGRWVEDVRSIEDLDVSYAAQLDAVPHWSWDSTAVRRRRDSESNFDVGYLVLLDFFEENGHARVPGMIDGETSELGRWVKARRDDFKSGRLSNEQKAKLNSLDGWVWDEQLAKFLDSVERVRRFTLVHGSSLIPRSFRDPVDGFSLGDWVHKQRQKYAREELQGDRVSALQEVAGWRWEA